MFEKVGKYSRKCRIKETSICILADPGSRHILSTLTVTWLEDTKNFGDKYIAPVRSVISLSDVNSPHF